MLNHFDERALNSIIYFTERGYKFITDIHNLLYCFDLIHYKETGGMKALGIDWFAGVFGPYPIKLHVDIENLKYQDIVKLINPDGRNRVFVAMKQFNGLHFSKRHMKILKEVVNNYIPYNISTGKTDIYTDCSMIKYGRRANLSDKFFGTDILDLTPRQQYNTEQLYRITDVMWNQWCGFTCEQMLDTEENNNDKKILEEIFKNG